jgi:hypothetical protein
MNTLLSDRTLASEVSMLMQRWPALMSRDLHIFMLRGDGDGGGILFKLEWTGGAITPRTIPLEALSRSLDDVSRQYIEPAVAEMIGLRFPAPINEDR